MGRSGPVLWTVHLGMVPIHAHEPVLPAYPGETPAKAPDQRRHALLGAYTAHISARRILPCQSREPGKNIYLGCVLLWWLAGACGFVCPGHYRPAPKSFGRLADDLDPILASLTPWVGECGLRNDFLTVEKLLEKYNTDCTFRFMGG